MDDTDDPSGLSQYTLYETKVYVARASREESLLHHTPPAS